VATTVGLTPTVPPVYFFDSRPPAEETLRTLNRKMPDCSTLTPTQGFAPEIGGRHRGDETHERTGLHFRFEVVNRGNPKP
jgi:hypothetical protein